MERVQRAAVAALVGAAVVAFTRSAASAAPWLLVAGVSIFWQIRKVPAGVVVASRLAVRVVAASVLVLGWTLMAYPVLSTSTEALATLACGYALLLLSACFLLSPAFPRTSTLFPAVAALLALACFDPQAHVRGAVAVAGLALFVSLAAEAPRWSATRTALLGASALAAFLIARWIVGVLPIAQTKVEEVGLGMLAIGPASSGMSMQVHLGELSKLKLSSAVVLRVFGPAARKLRGRVYTTFDGRGWRAGSSDAVPLAPFAPAALAGTDLAPWSDAIPGRLFGEGRLSPRGDAMPAGVIASRILQRLVTPGLMVAPGGVRLVRAPVDELGLDGFGLLRPPASAEVEVYGVVSERVSDVTVPGTADAPLLAACLDVPADTDPRFRELADRLGNGLTTPRQRIDRTVNYVASACHYSLEPGAFQSRQPVAEFLFEKRRGYCEYFASAAAVLLRLQGVPARYVTGFNLQEGNREGGHYVVRESDAHAWIEAYVPEAGWVEADPTPASEYQALHAQRPDVLAASLEWLKGEWAALWVALRFGDWHSRLTVAGVVLALGGLAAVARAWLRRRRVRVGPPTSKDDAPPSVPPQLVALLARVEAEWARRGLARPPSRGLLEHAAALPLDKVSAELREAAVEVATCFYRSRFGAAAVPFLEIDALSRRVDQASRAQAR